MNSKTWKNKVLSLCLVIATITTYSMVALANTKVVGEISMSNNASSVKVNGEVAQNGHSIFSSSTIVTPNNTDAIVNLSKLGKVKLDSASTVKLSFDSNNFTSTLVNGKLTVMSSANDTNTVINIGNTGKLKLAPSTALTIAFDGNSITGNLLAGEATVINTSKTINITNLNGKVSKLNTGDTTKVDDDDDDDDNGGGFGPALWVLVLGGAAAGIIIAATTDNNRLALGGGTTVISPRN